LIDVISENYSDITAGSLRLSIPLAPILSIFDLYGCDAAHRISTKVKNGENWSQWYGESQTACGDIELEWENQSKMLNASSYI
jgi:hypothetical protein